MDLTSLLLWLVIGGVAGWIAGMVRPTGRPPVGSRGARGRTARR